MPKPYSILRVKCSHKGCVEFARYEADSRRHYIELEKTYGFGKWRCTRHSRPDEVLSLENPRIVHDLVSRQEPHGRYFGNSGFVFGPGFKAFANDFPTGTILRVMAEIIEPIDKESPNV